MRSSSLPFRFLLLAAVLICPIPSAAAPPAAAMSPDEIRLRAILDAKLTFPSYVFGDEMFPVCSFEQPAKAEELLGPHTIKVTWYGPDRRVAAAAKAPGIYGAVIEVQPKEGSPLCRYATLYRVEEKINPDWHFSAEKASDLARLTGLNADVSKQEAALIGEQLKQRPFSDWSKDARIARLLAGLSLEKVSNGPARKNADAFALERQSWVDLKRQLAGLDKVYAKPFVGPRPLDGKPSPVVHEGTLAEAGMKPDAAEKINAALEAWAADDDQAFAVCVVRHGVIVLHKAYGERDGKPMTVRTKSWMASITKTMSASLMMQLVDQGLVSLDDPVDKYLPALRDRKVSTPLTIRHLYTHTSGLHKWPGWNDELSDADLRVADYYAQLGVGKEWGYNGTGYILGGKIIENVTGEAVPLFFQKHLLDPLGCPDTDVIGTHADAQSVPLDIARFGQMVLNRGSYGKWQFFRPETFEKMLPQKLTDVLGPEATKTFGIGLDGNRERIGHGAASAATFSVDLKDDLVVVMTRNKQGKNQDKYNGKFWDAIRQGIDGSGEAEKAK